MRSYVHIPGLLLLVSLMGGCSTVGELEINKLDQVKNDEIIVVGKIKFDPVVNEVEQPLHIAFPFNFFDNPDKYRNKIFITIGSELVDVRNRHIMTRGNTSVDLEKTFFIKVKRANILYYSGGRISTHIVVLDDSQPAFPGGIKYQVKPEDKAIYIGTIEYYRDFGEVEKINFINEYPSANEEFIKKFGNNIKLRQAKPEKA